GRVRRGSVALHFLEVGIDDVVFRRLGAIGRSRARSRLLGLHVGVHLFAELLRGGGQGLDLGVDGGLVVALDGFFKFLDGRFDGFLFGGFELVAVFRQGLARGVDQAVGLVARLRQFGDAVVFLGVGLGVLHHALDLFLGQARAGLDRDLVFLAGALVLGRHVQDAVGVDVEGDL